MSAIITAFQKNAFQNNAFQIAAVVFLGGDDAPVRQKIRLPKQKPEFRWYEDPKKGRRYGPFEPETVPVLEPAERMPEPESPAFAMLAQPVPNIELPPRLPLVAPNFSFDTPRQRQLKSEASHRAWLAAEQARQDEEDIELLLLVA